jgi:nicotinamidase-related amidase
MMENQPHMYDEHPEIAFNASFEEIAVTRPAGYISVLKSQDLESWLRYREVKSLVLCGISTSGCVLSTARAAGMRSLLLLLLRMLVWIPSLGYMILSFRRCCRRKLMSLQQRIFRSSGVGSRVST